MHRPLSDFRSTVFAMTAAATAMACSPEEEQKQTAEEVIGRLSAVEISVGTERAEALLAEAERAANAGRDEVARGAYERALAIYQAAEDMGGQGNTLLGMATLARYSGQGEKAREIYAGALNVFEEAGDSLGAARVVFALGELERARFNNEEALAAFQTANDVFHHHAEWALEAQALLGIADSERRLSRILNADSAVVRARAIYEILGDQEGRASAEQAWNELQTYVNQHDETRLQLAFDIGDAEQVGSRLRKAQGYLGLGALESAAGHPTLARDSFESAREVFAEMQVPNGEFDAWAAQGDMERRLQNMDAARDAYERALAAYGKARTTELHEALEHEETAIDRLDSRAALVLIGLGRLGDEVLEIFDGEASALTRFSQARELAPEGLSASVDGAFLIGLGQLDQEAGHTDKAAAAFVLAEKIYMDAELHVGAGQALLAQARLHHDLGKEIALDTYARALRAFLAAQDRIGEATARWWMAKHLSAAGGGMEASVQYRIAAWIFGDLELSERAAAALEAAHSFR